jgi:CshA-type fibril repeat protein
VIPAANAQAGNLGAAAAGPLAQPGAQAALQAQAQNLAQQQGMNPGAAERSCLQDHWGKIAAVTFLGLGGAAAAGLYLARNAIWPPEVNPPKPKPKPQPQTQTITASGDFMDAAGKMVSKLVIDLTDPSLQTPEMHGFDVTTFAFAKPDGDGHDDRRTSVNGVYKLDKVAKTLTFFPIANFMGGSAETGFTVANPNAASAAKTLTGKVVLTYPRRPTVFDQILDHSKNPTNPVSVNVITGTLVSQGLQGKAQAAEKGTDDIDPTTVTFAGFERLDPLDTTTEPVYSNMNQSMQVPNQGTWTADKAGVVTFTPVAGFSDAPYPAAFQIGDLKKRPSNTARVMINPEFQTVLERIEALAKKDDDVFWTAYENALIQANPPVDVALWNEANALVLTYTNMHINITEKRDALKVNRTQYATKVVRSAYDDWEMGAFDPQGNQLRPPYDRQYLWDTYIKPIDDAGTGLPPGKLGTRFVRLSYLDRLLSRYLRDLN